jgi:molybdopterin/thiamine biosynthesis adenylyltransferase
MEQFDYELAFSRNIGWVTPQEQAALKGKKVAVGGLGGVGGSHLITLARMGIGKFHISDLDAFELANFNRQYGASINTLNKPKAEVMEQTIREINPDVEITNFKEGISLENLDDFLRGVDIYLDSLDIFALEIRRAVFARCHELGIPAITAGPMGMGTALLIFMPGKMNFEEYFDLDGYYFEEQVLRFVMGVSPTFMQRKYLVDNTSINLFNKKAPSTAMGIELAAGVACTNAIKILLGRGEVICAPWGIHFDAYRNKMIKTWRPWGNKNPLQKMMFLRLKRLFNVYRPGEK